MPHLLLCFSAVHLSPSRSSPRYYQGSTGKRSHPQGKNSNVSRGHSSFIRILPQNTYFSFQDQFYEQVKGVANGSPVSPIVVNLYMEYFEQEALSIASHPQLMVPVYGKTFLIQKEENNQNFLEHINSVDLPGYIIYSGEKQGGWCHPLFGHLCKTRD